MDTALRTKKICLVGDFGVGKTSVVARFVNHTFSDKYQSTFGVSIKTKTIAFNDKRHLKLIIWDIAGNDVITETSGKYLFGADGYVLVADGTRPITALAAIHLREQVDRACGPIPWVCLLNKYDLRDDWRVTDNDEYSLRTGAVSLHHTSAKTGANVEQAFFDLARAIDD